MTTWSNLFSKTSKEELLDYLEENGYYIVAEGECPVGAVPDGSVVLTDMDGERAIWFDGYIYQKTLEGEIMWSPDDETEPDEQPWATDLDGDDDNESPSDYEGEE